MDLRHLALLVILPSAAWAQDQLPYSERTRSFSGWRTTVHGDIRTVGMSGASVGLADTFIAALDSPAGLAMTVGIGDIHYAQDDTRDGYIQNTNAPLHTDSVGLALGLYPWAISAGYVSPYREEATYNLPGVRVNPVALSVTTREFVLSAARLFWGGRLSLGASLLLGQAVRELDPSSTGSETFSSFTGGVSLGSMIQLPKRFLLATSFGSPKQYSGASSQTNAALKLPGFFQAVDVPWRVSAGIGWIPNRFFRADFTTHVIGATTHSALVRDQAVFVGQHVTVQPRLGVAYVFADYKEFKATLFLGGYLESPRVSGADLRPHGTAGLETRIWIFTAGAGFDVANVYRNVLLSVGVDVFGVMARLDMIPTPWTPARAGMFPKPWAFSDEGLPRPLVKDWKNRGPDIDPIKVVAKIPSKLRQGMANAAADMEKIAKDVADAMAETNKTDEDRAQEAAQAKAAAAARAKAAAAAKAAREAEEAEVEDAKEAEEARAAEDEKQAAKPKHPKKKKRRKP